MDSESLALNPILQLPMTFQPVVDDFSEKGKYKVVSFSANNFFTDSARKAIEEKYHSLLEVSQSFDRRAVSFQLSKKARVHGWLKYKEGFSAELVNQLIDEFNLKPEDTILDPFLGSGTTSLVAQVRNINSIGYDILPTSKIAIAAKQHILDYDISEILKLIADVKRLKLPKGYTKKVNAIPITEGAYPKDTDYELAYLLEWRNNNAYSEQVNNLLLLALVNSLERLSYTNKDGQYLRWDYRSQKVIDGNKKRGERGLGPFKTVLDKGTLPSTNDIVVLELETILSDIRHVQESNGDKATATLNYVEDSVLKVLPTQKESSISAVITSPPYCNRYDYTRTYALELAFLGLNNEDVKRLRQTLLSCTVENKSKVNELEAYYQIINRPQDYKKIINIIRSDEALAESLDALKARSKNGDLNNNSVLKMVEGYFTELGIVFAELYRTCRPGAKVAFVNDNVRYGGEIIPVDYLSTSLAESFGFEPVKIICLKQQKGNSSQQMKKYGRAPLRKSITVWRKPANNPALD